MANCVQCGRELPSFSVGGLRDRCPGCQFQEQQRQAAQPQTASRKLTLVERARAFPVTTAIVGLNLGVYVVCVVLSLLTHTGGLSFESPMLLKLGADYGPLTLGGQWWRVFTAMFLHGGLIHVGANMYGLWDFGAVTERIYGRGRYAFIYLATGVASSLASVAWHAQPVVSVGASGAIFGVVGALVWPFYRRRLNMPAPVMSAMFRDIAMVIVVNLIIGASIPVIDNAAHVGGLLAGFVLGAVFVQLAGAGEEIASAVKKVSVITAALLVAAFFAVRHERTPDFLPWQALTALENGNLAGAQSQAQRAVAERPNRVEPHVALGEVLLQKHDFPAALHEYQTAHQIAPHNSGVTGRLGYCYYRLADWKNAEPLLRAGLKDNPKDPDLLVALGVTLSSTGRSDEGIGYVRQAVQIDPQDAGTQFFLGDLLAQQGKFAQALPPLQEAVRLDPKNQDYRKALQMAEQQSRGAAK